MTYNDWCENQDCPHFVQWGFTVEDYEQPYICTSCKLQGQSYDITEIAKDCPNRGKP